MDRIFLDNSATTQVDEAVIQAMLPFMRAKFGNPSSLHTYGTDALEGMDVARANTAKAIGASPKEIFFTGSGTEADNLALQGMAFASRGKGRHIITSAIEHHAILHTCDFLEREGFKVTYISVDGDGLVNPDNVAKAIRKDTVLVSIMAANNEIGTIQPIREIGKLAADSGIPFHTDAVQAITKMPLDVTKDNISLLSMSGHKFHGPKGVGALFVREGLRPRPLTYGGGQEKGLRPSTENVPGIVGMGEALRISMEQMSASIEKMTRLRDRIIDGTLGSVPGSHLNGHRSKRLCNNANFRFDMIDGEALIYNLDYEGIAASTGSACSARSSESSHVLRSLGLSDKECKGSLRISLTRTSTKEDAEAYLNVIPRVIGRLRGLAPDLASAEMEVGTCHTTRK